MTRVAGVDGCPAGWLCVVRDLATGKIVSSVHEDADALFRGTMDAAVVAIDIPIGLPDSGPRVCDQEARRLLRPGRSASVFPTPMRASLAGWTYHDACALSTAACGKSLSKQTYAILPKIREVDSALRLSPELQQRVREVHPEVCFHRWNGGRPMEHPKRSFDGHRDRRLLVEEAFGPVYERVRQAHSRKAVADDDILDAFAALWTAQRITEGRAVTIPAEPPRDGEGLPMEMVA